MRPSEIRYWASRLLLLGVAPIERDGEIVFPGGRTGIICMELTLPRIAELVFLTEGGDHEAQIRAARERLFAQVAAHITKRW